MLTEQRHRIRRQVLELTTGDEATARQLRPELGLLHHRRLVALIDRRLTEASAPDRLHRIDRLEIDLGALDPENLERDFVDKLDVRLRRELAQRLREEERPAAGRGEDSGTGSRLELLDLFVCTGRLPWWADASVPHLISDTLDHLVRHAPRPLAAWLRQLSAPALKRLVLHADDERLTALCDVLVSPSEPPRARPRDLEALLAARRRTPLGGTSSGGISTGGISTGGISTGGISTGGISTGITPERYRAAVWQAVLRTICGAGSHDARTFWSTVLTRLAVALGTTLATLVEGLRETLGTSRGATPLDARPRSAPEGAKPPGAPADALGTLVESLAREMAGEVRDDGPGRQLEEIRQILARLRRPASTLKSEEATRPQEPARQAAERLFAALGALAQRLPAERRGPWLVALRDLDRRRREGGWAAPATAHHLLRVLRLAVEERLLPADVMRRHLAALEATSPTLRGSPEMLALQRRLRETATAAKVDDEAAEAVVEASTFSDADAVYVDNAGLAVLAPFLGHFFEHLGLTADQQFHNGDARQRAVGLLQYLVTEDRSPPEYLLTLNKVLCGMAIDEVFDFGPPVTDEEAEECASLLTAAIGHAPILGEMSHAGFRGSFLLRKGALSAEAGAWLLRVERETHDVVLDRFPWSVSWVKLPWMEAPLRVEW